MHATSLPPATSRRGDPRVRAHRPYPSRQRHRGQALVEFALAFPVFVFIVMGVIEFSMMFNAQLSLNYATRDAALIAAEAGSAANADCLILRQVDAFALSHY